MAVVRSGAAVWRGGRALGQSVGRGGRAVGRKGGRYTGGNAGGRTDGRSGFGGVSGLLVSFAAAFLSDHPCHLRGAHRTRRPPHEGPPHPSPSGAPKRFTRAGHPSETGPLSGARSVRQKLAHRGVRRR